MYSIEEFAQETAVIVNSRLGKGYEAEIYITEKINTGKKYALVIKDSRNNVSPNFYLDSAYSIYISGGYTVVSLAENIIREYNNVKGSIKEYGKLHKHLSEKVWMEERLFLQLINTDKNKGFLSDAVHSDSLGLSLVLYALVADDSNGIAKVKITKEICRGFGWDEKEILCYALGNTEKLFPAELCPLESMLNMFLNMEGDIKVPGTGIPEGWDGVTVLSNQRSTYGAVSVFYPGVLKGVAEKEKTDLFLIPSSIHEFIIVRDNGICRKECLGKMLWEINRTDVTPGEVLSDSIYHYNYKNSSLSVLDGGYGEAVIL